MFKIILKLLLSLSFCFGLSVCLTDEAKMIVEVTKSYEKPTNILVHSCWKFPDKFDLMGHFKKSIKTTTVLFISDYMEIEKFDPIHSLVVTDLNCMDTRKFLNDVDDNLIFRKPYRWLILSKENDEIGVKNGIPEELRALKIFLDTEVALAQKVDNNTFHLNLIYRTDATTEFCMEPYGVWTTTEGFKISDDIVNTTITIRRKDLNGKPIAASYVASHKSTRTKIHELTDLKMDNIAKATYHLIDPLYDFMNATKVLVFTNTWGYYINNSWSGMMGDMIHGEAELAGTVSFINLQRIHLIQYITTPMPIRPKFVFREPPLSLQNNLFTLPFRSAVWLCIAGLVIILIIIIYISAKWETAKDEEKVMEDPLTLKANLSDIWIFVMSAITQQGSNNELKGSGRVVSFLMFLIFLFLYTSYSANIVALLQSSSNQIRTLSDLLNSKLELGVEDEPYNWHYFPSATDPVRKAIYENKVFKTGYKPNFMSVEEGVSRLQNKDSPFAFHMNTGIGYKIVESVFQEHEKCGLHEIEYHPNSLPWTCSRKATPYREIYKIGLYRNFEHGLGDRTTRLFYSRKPQCNVRGANFASVNMVDFHPVLLWMLYGMLLSLCLLVVEILVYRHGRSIQCPH